MSRHSVDQQTAHDASQPASWSQQPTIGDYVQAFSPGPLWDELPAWPPDVFAVSNLVLDHTEAYRFAVAPPIGRRWPPRPSWNDDVVAAARAWRAAAARSDAPPAAVLAPWEVVTERRDTPLASVRSGESWDLFVALLTLHAMADEACHGLARPERTPDDAAFERRAWEQLAQHGSLARLAPARVRILPKTHFAGGGVTIRSFSRYLALCYDPIDLRWQRTEAAARWYARDRPPRDFNIVLVPWPLSVRSSDFHEVEGPLDNMDREAFGFFEFAPQGQLPLDHLAALVEAAHRHVHRIDAVILPEAALDVSEVGPIEDLLLGLHVRSLIAGTREAAPDGGLGQNRLHIGVRSGDGWHHLEQSKHHRWCLDAGQIRQYHLSSALDPSRLWWEAIDLPERRTQVLDMGGGATVTPLICEDLARLDEVADVLRRIGPTLVITLLLDGPQLAGRWSCRYATVLADDPGSCVLTLSALGMVTRSRPKGLPARRSIALWNDRRGGLRELELDRGAGGMLITAALGDRTVWTADGRRHDDATPDLSLSTIHQLVASS